MICQFFGQCGGCNLPLNYADQLAKKVADFRQIVDEFDMQNIEIFATKEMGFRNRSEFRISKENPIKLAMNRLEEKSLIRVENCPITNIAFSGKIVDILATIDQDNNLKEKLYGINFLANTDASELVLVLIYHKKLDETFDATKLACQYNISVVARSRGVKKVFGKDFVEENIELEGKIYNYKHLEGSFTQPNGFVNQKMISWVLSHLETSDQDLLELYCGSGNFTLPLSSRFRSVVAIEISKSSLATARENAIKNGIKNIFFARMDANEFASAYKKDREFFRLKELDINSLEIDTIFVDPPRAGLDDDSLALAEKFRRIVYISCNPATLARDLKLLTKTHTIRSSALFDQFAYTSHLEAGVILTRG